MNESVNEFVYLVFFFKYGFPNELVEVSSASGRLCRVVEQICWLTTSVWEEVIKGADPWSREQVICGRAGAAVSPRQHM